VSADHEPSRLPVILLVEDDAALRGMLRTSLPPHGYRVIDAASGEDALALARERGPDVVVLDLGLPGIDGLEVARRLRGWSAVPIIVLSARGQEQSKVALLDAGADDYLTKPFGMGELLARIRAALRHARRSPAAEESVFRCGPLIMDRAERRVTLDGELIDLTPTEYDLLAALARRPGHTLTHQELAAAVWGRGAAAAGGRLRVYMTYLRRKLEADPQQPRLLRTQVGVGYRLHCEDEGRD